MHRSIQEPIGKDGYGFDLPAPDRSLDEARMQIALRFDEYDLVWVVDQRYDETLLVWDIDIVCQGANGQWVRQRYRFDEQSKILYWLGERALRSDQFRAARSGGTMLPIAVLQNIAG